MKESIDQIRAKSAIIHRLYQARQLVAEALYVKLRNDIYLTAPLIEALGRLDERIKRLKIEIKVIFRKLPGYSKEKHITVEYLAQVDLIEPLLDISTNQDGSAFLNIETGEIL